VSSIGGFLRSAGDTLLSAAGDFLSNLAAIQPLPLLGALACFAMFQLLNSRASLNALRAAYPETQIRWRHIWGAYVTAFGLNGVVPAGGGSIAQLVLSRRSIRGSTYPAVAVALSTTGVFVSFVCAVVLVYGFLNGLPQITDFVDLSSFDLKWIGEHPGLTAAIAGGAIVAIAVGLLMARRRIGADLRRGLSILRSPRRFLLGMALPQAIGWGFRVLAIYWMLIAFGMPATANIALLVLGAQVMAMIVPITPGGAGAQQALIVAVITQVSADKVAAFAVGQQIAVVAFTLLEALAASVLVFRAGGLRDVLRQTRGEHAETANASYVNESR